MLIVKSSSKNAHIEWEKEKLKVMVQVDHTSRPLLKYVCSKVLSATRYDKLFLARGNATDKTAQVSVPLG